MSDQGLEARFDTGFGKELSWDIDLLGGYESQFLNMYKKRRMESFWGLRLKRGFGQALRKMDADVLWIQGWQVAAYWQAVSEARKVGTEVWLRGETNVRSNAGRIGQPIRRWLLRQLVQRVDRFLYIGEANRQFYVEQGVGNEQLTAAPYCVDNARFAAAATLARAKRGRIREDWRIPPEAFCFLFAGKFLARKRPFDLIAAAQRLTDAHRSRKIHLLWIGMGQLDEELRHACNVRFDVQTKGLVDERKNNKPDASFVGFLNQSEISRAYVAADCLVLPSDATETWGLVVNEAMASGLPCIVSDACGCAEDLIMPIRSDLCFQMGHISELQRAMTAVMENTPSSQLFESHISTYDAGKTIDAVEKLYVKGATERPQQRISKLLGTTGEAIR